MRKKSEIANNNCFDCAVKKVFYCTGCPDNLWQAGEIEMKLKLDELRNNITEYYNDNNSVRFECLIDKFEIVIKEFENKINNFKKFKEGFLKLNNEMKKATEIIMNLYHSIVPINETLEDNFSTDNPLALIELYCKKLSGYYWSRVEKKFKQQLKIDDDVIVWLKYKSETDHNLFEDSKMAQKLLDYFGVKYEN